MPIKMWKHSCCEGTSGILSGAELCVKCGKPGEYQGWHFKRHEAMAVYQNTHGLKPIGPHRPLADRLFVQFQMKCAACDGTGLLNINFGRDYWVCRTCDGAGYCFQLEKDQIEGIRRKVLEIYPDVAVNTRIADICSATLVFNSATNTVEDLLRSDSYEPEQ